MAERPSSERLCPRCQLPLARLTRGELVLDAYRACGGVWFDAQELEQLRQRHRGALSFLDESLHPRRQGGLLSAPTPLCPVCRIPLVSFVFPNVPQVTLDGCRQCRGIWTDHGELRQLEATVRTATAAPEPTGAFPCPHCGARVYPTDAQCLDCGKPILPPQPAKDTQETPPQSAPDLTERARERMYRPRFPQRPLPWIQGLAILAVIFTAAMTASSLLRVYQTLPDWYILVFALGLLVFWRVCHLRRGAVVVGVLLLWFWAASAFWQASRDWQEVTPAPGILEYLDLGGETVTQRQERAVRRARERRSMGALLLTAVAVGMTWQAIASRRSLRKGF